jgi:hypothetical protein
MADAPLNLFGILAIRHGIVRSEQLRLLLEEQAREKGTPIGELARRRGILTARQIRYLLEVQRSGSVDPAATAFGALLLHNGFASQDELGLALKAQYSSAADLEPTPPLGQILVDMGTLDTQQATAILAAQRRLRGADESGELDFETRIMPAVSDLPAQSGNRPEPQGWMIQETGDDLGNLFPLRHHAIVGRLPEHDIPVPDMASSRDHAVIDYSPTLKRHVISDLDSRNGTFLNGAQLIRPHPLQPGDRIQIGSTVFRYVAGGGIGEGQSGVVTRLGQDAARAAKGVASRAIPMLRGAASAAGDTARRFMSSRQHRIDFLRERRDVLLNWLGFAAFDADPDSPASHAVTGAQLKLEEVSRGSDAVLVRWAERRVAESVRQLGRLIVERGPAPEGGMPVIIEIREIDAEIASTQSIPTEPSPAE